METPVLLREKTLHSPLIPVPKGQEDLQVTVGFLRAVMLHSIETEVAMLVDGLLSLEVIKG